MVNLEKSLKCCLKQNKKKYIVNSLLFVVYQFPWIVTNREIQNLMNIYHRYIHVLTVAEGGSTNLCIHKNKKFHQTTNIGIYEFR